MAKAAATNYTATADESFEKPGADSDQFDRDDILKLGTAVDLHNHGSGRGLGVLRLQTGSAPASAGQVQVTGDLLKWWGATASAVKTAASLDGAQELTNKTITAPVLKPSSGNTLTLPDATDTVATLAATQTFTNKTLTTPVIAAIKPSASNTLTLPDATDTVATLAASQTFTNKTLTSPTLNTPTVNQPLINGPAYLGDNANASNDLGLTIAIGDSRLELLSFKWSSVTHNMTSVTEDDTFGYLKPASTDGGGLAISGFSNDKPGLTLTGWNVNGDTNKTTAARGYVEINAYNRAGAGPTVGTPNANTNLLVVRSAASTKFILDADGDSHQDVGTAWTNFDSFDDVALLTTLSVAVSKPLDPIRESFGQFLEENRGTLERARLVSFNDDGHNFVNMSRLAMLLVGAVRQLGAQVTELRAQIAAPTHAAQLLGG